MSTESLANTRFKVLQRAFWAAAVVTTITACSSSGSLRADSPVDAAVVPDANELPTDANVDNRGPGGE
jgi:hypothetical protein